MYINKKKKKYNYLSRNLTYNFMHKSYLLKPEAFRINNSKIVVTYGNYATDRDFIIESRSDAHLSLHL